MAGSESKPGDPDWRAELETAASTSFGFVGSGGHFTARREVRRQDHSYWYAYRKHKAKLYKAYLGRTAGLTLDRLEAVAAVLTASIGRSTAERTSPGVPGASQRPGNLPPELTSFVGRERDLTEVRQLVRDSRLVTITGVGGVGKTRLALRVARTAQSEYRDGAWLLQLASVDDAQFVAQSVAEILGVAESPGQPLLESLAGGLFNRHLLLVLDNCEHLLAACAEVTGTLVRRCPEGHPAGHQPRAIGQLRRTRPAPFAVVAARSRTGPGHQRSRAVVRRAGNRGSAGFYSDRGHCIGCRARLPPARRRAARAGACGSSGSDAEHR